MIHLEIRKENTEVKVAKEQFGQFVEHLGRCIYDGIWVGSDSPIPNENGIRSDVLQALQELKIPVLRWPGGCFADDYHWEDGIGPRDQRPRRVNRHWERVVEDNQFGTHEFLELCEAIGAKPYICGNVGSGTPAEMSQWLEYMTYDGDSTLAEQRRQNGQDTPWRVDYFGVGNESWGCGGNMTPEYYAMLYRRFSLYAMSFNEERTEKIACGANVDDYHWTEVLMRDAGGLFDGLSLHNYTFPGTWQEKGFDTHWTEAEWCETMVKALRMDELITKHSEIMDTYDPQRRVNLVVDEWGTWFAPENAGAKGLLYQENTVRDALVVALHLHIFQRHAERVRMANIAQTVNVLQAMILTQGDKMVLTPSYHMFKMMNVHQDAVRLGVKVSEGSQELYGHTLPRLDAAATTKDGKTHVSLVNVHPTAKVACAIDNKGGTYSAGTAEILAAEVLTAQNTFEQPDAVVPRNLPLQWHDHRIVAELPPGSVAVLTLT